MVAFVDAELPLCGNCKRELVEGVITPRVLPQVMIVPMLKRHDENEESARLCSLECCVAWLEELFGVAALPAQDRGADANE